MASLMPPRQASGPGRLAMIDDVILASLDDSHPITAY